MFEQLAAREPNDPHWHADLAVAYARSNRREDAVREARQAVQMSEWSHDAHATSGIRTTATRAYALAGEEELAIQLLDELLSRPGPTSVSLLRLDPLYDPLRNNPRFQALLAKYEN